VLITYKTIGTEMPKSMATSLKVTLGETICRIIPHYLIWTQLGRENDTSVLNTHLVQRIY
jgi:hypothetical protein